MNSIIGVAILVLFQFLPHVAQAGRMVLGVFLAPCTCGPRPWLDWMDP